MGEIPAAETEKAAKHGWQGVVAALAGGGACIWLGGSQLASPDECGKSHKLLGRLMTWACETWGGVPTGILLILMGVVVLFSALLPDRHDT
ncbi:hypothetical protein PAGU2595_027620 [Lysobacter xanthus]